MKKIILNADDFGASKVSNEAIKQAILAGRLNSVSVMVNMPYFQDAVAFLKKHPEINVGLHFNITEGKQYRGVRGTILGMLFGKLSLSLVEQELSTQFSTLKETGLRISHIDSHEHIHLFPSVYALVVRFARKHHVPRVRGHRMQLSHSSHVLSTFTTVKQLAIWIGYSFNYLFHRNAKQKVNHFLFDLNWRDTYEPEYISKLFRSLPSGTVEVACHLSLRVTSNKLSYGRRECLCFLVSTQFDTIRKRYHVSLT